MKSVSVFDLAESQQRLNMEALVDIHSLIKTLHRVNEDTDEEQVEKDWCQDTALLHPIGDLKRVILFAVWEDLYCHANMEDLMICMSFCGQSYHASTDQRASLLTVSKALVRLMNTEYKSRLCSMHFSWTVSLRKSCWMCCTLDKIHTSTSGWLASDIVMSQFRMT